MIKEGLLRKSMDNREHSTGICVHFLHADVLTDLG